MRSTISIPQLRAAINGRVITLDDAGYDQARTSSTAASISAAPRSSSWPPTPPTSRASWRRPAGRHGHTGRLLLDDRTDKGPRMNAKDVFHKVATRIHRVVFRASKGRLLGKIVGLPVAELVTTGRRSGKPRSTMLAVPIVQGDRLVLVASFGGDDRDPAWYRNLNANPRVRVTFAGSTQTMIARTTSEQERARLWPQIIARYQGYARYQQRTKRPIPVVILQPDRPPQRIP